MKIYLTGGGTGGHFFPIIAVARAVKKISWEQKIIPPELFFASSDYYDKTLLFQEDIKFRFIPAGKIRRYFSFWNIFDLFKTMFGLIKAIFQIYLDFPDVVFAKGGYASFPALLAARILKIPTIIHESDSIPGKVNEWAGKFAKKVAISFPETLRYFPQEKTALTGNPIRKEILGGNAEEAEKIFNLGKGLPVILILGGSQGAKKINDIILDVLVELVKNYEIIHQTGENNLKEIKMRTNFLLEKSDFKQRYHPYGFLDEGSLRNASYIASLVISRAGAGAIFEIAAWNLPAILIPIVDSAQDHQRQNAYNYARSGAAEVIEETNLTSHIFILRVERIIKNKDVQQKMRLSAQGFAKIDAAEKIGAEIIKLGLEHV